MKRSSELKADIAKIKKLKALQQKATDKLDKMADKSAVKPAKKKPVAVKKPVVKAKTNPVIKRKPAAVKRKTGSVKRKAAPKHKAKAPVARKSYFWRTLFGKKNKASKRTKAKEVGYRS